MRAIWWRRLISRRNGAALGNPETEAVEDQCRSAMTVANTAAMTADNT
jgi:hypothetical protein